MTFNHPSNYDINTPIASDIEVESCCRTVSVGIVDALRQFPEIMSLCRALEAEKWQFAESMILCDGEKYETVPRCWLIEGVRQEAASRRGELRRKGL